MELFSSALIGPSIGVTIGLCIYFVIKHRSQSTFFLLSGFILVGITSLSINHCLRGISLDIPIESLPLNFVCNSYMPDIKGLGFILIATGLGKLFEELRSNA